MKFYRILSARMDYENNWVRAGRRSTLVREYDIENRTVYLVPDAAKGCDVFVNTQTGEVRTMNRRNRALEDRAFRMSDEGKAKRAETRARQRALYLDRVLYTQ